MKVTFEVLRFSTKSKFEVIDVTDEVEEAVTKSGVRDGICLVYVPHATAALIANESESGLLQDFINKLREDFPPEGAWLHNRIDDNAHAHLASAFIGASRTFPVRDRRLVRGTWQNLLLLELDGPRTRRIVVEVLGE